MSLMETNHDTNAPAFAPEPCALCEKAPGTIDAIDCDEPVRVCRDCFDYYADGDAEEFEA
jgi:hypothetical protein